MKSKRGQFYIIAAIIIVVIISGIATTVTYTVTKSAPKGIKELSGEVRQEIPRIELYGAYNKTDVNQLINNFTNGDLKEYFFSKTDESSMTMIYRNSSGAINVMYYTKINSGTTSVQGWDIEHTIDYSNSITVNTFFNDQNEEITNVTILNKSFEFKLDPNQNFYFVIMQNKSGEQYVETG